MFAKNTICLYFLLFACLLSRVSFSQNAGSIQGKVSGKSGSIEFATVSLFTTIDSSKGVRNSITDSSGHFQFTALKSGKYQLRIETIGYTSTKINIHLISQQIPMDVGIITLSTDSKQLKEVMVTSQKKLIQKTAQGLIINAAANLTQLGGTATDLLRSTPTIVVDEDGVITLRGKTPLILINGRNTGLTNPNQIPASSIETIEIINNPSAKYDAASEGGIINIKLKKNKKSGTNGALALGAGVSTKGRVNSSLLLSHKTKKFNVAIAYDNRFSGRTRHINADRVNFYLPNEYYLGQYRSDGRLELLQALRLNVDFSPNAKTTIGFEANTIKEGQDNEEDLTNTLQTQARQFNSKYKRFSNEIARSTKAEMAVNFNHQFAIKKKELSASISTSFDLDKENTDINTQPFKETNIAQGDPFLQRTHNYENGNITNLKTDYTHPVSEHVLITTGYKATLRSIDADFQSLNKTSGLFIPVAASSNIFKYREQIHAGYIQYSGFTGKEDNPKWKYDIGLRAEQVWNNGNTESNIISFSNNYFNLFPTASIAYFKATEEFWKMSYSRRIKRPNLGELNPFVDITDSLNQHGGNPYLKPELIHSLEVGYSKDWEKVSIYSTIFYRFANNSIRSYTIIKPNGVAITIPQNFGNAVTYGVENIFTAKPSNLYDFNVSISLFQQNINGSNVAYDLANNVVSWYGKIINNIVCWPGSKLQIIGIYNSPIALPQGKIMSIYNVDAGFQQKIGKGNSHIGLVVTDIFNTLKSGKQLYGSNFSYERISKVDARAVLITFAHTFGTSFKDKLLENKFSND